MRVPYTLKAELHHAWDGDTIWLIVDRGEGWQSKSKYRLFGVDTPEIRGASDEEEKYAREAKEFVEEKLSEAELMITTHKGKSKYDWMAEVFIREPIISMDSGEETIWDASLAQLIIEAGHGVAYFGSTKQSWAERKKMQDIARELFAARNAEEEEEEKSED
jgi:endonuclease YncB( thermonuclease family)